ncbi:Beta-galactosidase 15 [Vigna angularis]|uniref:beta-galactosidase n=1 Tax=Phaseolus angularis TaxID=3914 RepID=A0A8T0KH45_PHAAN|nr:Beta-galactosidase 15 [Vigna angularis]
MEGPSRLMVNEDCLYQDRSIILEARLKFLKTIQDAGLYAVLRIGPYVCAEWNYGGIPVWVYNLPGVEIRTVNDVFMNEMQNFTTLIVDMVKKERLFASQDGPIILTQIENEYGNVISHYGEAGKAYINWCANMAESLHVGVPWIMCQESDAPQPMVQELGWQRSTQDCRRCNIAQPKWGHLKELHSALKSMEETLTNGKVSEIDFGNSVKATVYATNGSSSCFLSNTNTTTDATLTFRGNKYTIPAWSVSLLPNCQHEEYNTAKVNVQTSLMIKENKQEKESIALKWTWRSENIDNALHAKSNISAHALIDQKLMASDTSDYLWYMTKLHLKHDDPIWSENTTLRINGSGHVIHAFVNGEHIGSHWATYGIHNDKFESKIKFKHGINTISLLSVTVGLQNYGPYFDTWHSGLVGPIELVSVKDDEMITKDLSSHKWLYKVGLNGWNHEFFSEDLSTNWESQQLPTNRMLTWYKTAFEAPMGSDPVVVDLKGMGKGYAWVNGENLGRIWPNYLAEAEGCSDEPCDYRGEYHVPRSFLRDDGENILVLFAEMGGNPSLVNFQTIAVGSACGNAYENKTLELSCQDRSISAIKFASFGDPKGVCGAFTKGSCESKTKALSVLQKECVGEKACSIDVSEKTFGPTTCGSITKRLAVEIVC